VVDRKVGEKEENEALSDEVAAHKLWYRIVMLS
jgi:hypothetical protein